MPLPDPPFFQYHLLESPWVLVVILMTGALVLRVMVRHSEKGGRYRWGSYALLLLVIGVAMLARSVVTQREQLLAQTQTLVQSTAPLVKDSLLVQLHPQMIVVDVEGRTMAAPGEAVDQLSGNINRWGLESHAVLDSNAQATSDTRGVSEFRLRTHFTNGYMVKTAWRLAWQRAAADQPWQVTEIQWMQLNDAPANARIINQVMK